MTNIFSYFGIQDLRTVANRVLAGDETDLTNRARVCTQVQQTSEFTGSELDQLASELAQNWHGTAADSGIAELHDAARKRREQADQLRRSATSFSAVADALGKAKATARRLLQEADDLGRRLDKALNEADDAINLLNPAAGVAEWTVKELTGADLEKEANKVVLELTRPILDNADGLLDEMEAAIRDYEQVLRQEGQTLRSMPGIVRKDAGPVDGPGDTDLRRGALFRSVYGRDPISPNDMLMAKALDMQGDDKNNVDPNSRVVVTHIKPVPGAGVVYGSAFIAENKVFDPHDPSSIQDFGDGRSFDPNADPSQSRASFFVDYEHGIVVMRQNASHTDTGTARVDDPTVGVEQDPSGRVRLHMEATNPLAPEVAKDAHVSVRGDVVVDPHGGAGTADANGKVTRFPSWEMYQRKDGEQPTTLLQRHENELPYGFGPGVGLPQPTIPVGQHPQDLDEWRHEYHPGQGHESGWSKLLQFPTTRDDDFFQYPVQPSPYPSVDGNGHLVVPSAHEVR